MSRNGKSNASQSRTATTFQIPNAQVKSLMRPDSATKHVLQFLDQDRIVDSAQPLNGERVLGVNVPRSVGLERNFVKLSVNLKTERRAVSVIRRRSLR